MSVALNVLLQVHTNHSVRPRQWKEVLSVNPQTVPTQHSQLSQLLNQSISKVLAPLL